MTSTWRQVTRLEYDVALVDGVEFVYSEERRLVEARGAAAAARCNPSPVPPTSFPKHSSFLHSSICITLRNNSNKI